MFTADTTKADFPQEGRPDALALDLSSTVENVQTHCVVTRVPRPCVAVRVQAAIHTGETPVPLIPAKSANSRVRLFVTAAKIAGMITHICDRCGRPIERGQLRYVAKIEVFAAADPLEITLEDLLHDTRREIDRLLQQCEGLSEEELMRDVYVRFNFDLCRACQKAYVTDPLAAASTR